MKTRAQAWSQVAFSRVQDKSSRDPKYKTSCNKMPGLIHQSGLLQALVFMCARDASGRRYVDHLAETYLQQEEVGHEELIAKVQGAPLTKYLAMSHDIAEIAQWFRRFAQILLADLGEGEDEG